MASTRSAVLLLTATALAALGPAGASQINTGDPIGAYHADFCPLLAAQLRLAQFDYACAASSGTRESMARVVADPLQLGYGRTFDGSQTFYLTFGSLVLPRYR